MKRRTAVQATLSIAGTVVLGCSDDDPDGPGGGNAGGSGAGSNNGGGDEGGAGAGSANGGAGGGASGGNGEGGAGGGPQDLCASDGGLSAADLLAPIKTIVVLCMENRSFDHYLGALKLVEGRDDIDGLDGTESNPSPQGPAVPVFNLLDYTPEDPPHGWDACHEQFNDGANDGFVIAHAGEFQDEVMGYHIRAQIPVTYAIADASAICDRWFCSVMGPTWPNRFYLHGATSDGGTGNSPIFFGFESIFDLLDEEMVSNKNYFHDVAWALGGYAKTNNTGIETFFDDAAAGTLPAFSIIDPQFFGDLANDDHPDHDIQLGQALIASVYNALSQSPQWNECLLIITYDEHGGFFDHVAPPTTVDELADFEQLGFRVPSLVCGPFVKKGCAISTTFEHVSIIKTLCVKYGLRHFNERVTAAADLSSCIQPEYLADPQPPVTLPEVEISMAKLAAKKARPGHHEEMRTVFDAIKAPPHLDRRHRADEIQMEVLRRGQKLGAVKLV